MFALRVYSRAAFFPGINQVTLLGRTGQDPQLRGTEEHAVTVFPLATSFTLKSPEGLYCHCSDLFIAKMSQSKNGFLFHCVQIFSNILCIRIRSPVIIQARILRLNTVFLCSKMC